VLKTLNTGGTVALNQISNAVSDLNERISDTFNEENRAEMIKQRDTLLNYFSAISQGKTFEEVQQSMDGVKLKTIEVADAFSSALLPAVGNVITALEDLFSGDASAGAFFQRILYTMIDFMGEFGKQLVALGIAALAMRSVLVNPFGAIAAGTALIGLAAGARKLLEGGPKAPKMATGGVIPDGFPNDTYPALLSSGERVIPDPIPLKHGLSGVGGGNMVLEGEFRVRGTDLILVLENAKRSFR
jgi:hypothetical protein